MTPVGPFEDFQSSQSSSLWCLFALQTLAALLFPFSQSFLNSGWVVGGRATMLRQTSLFLCWGLKTLSRQEAVASPPAGGSVLCCLMSKVSEPLLCVLPDLLIASSFGKTTLVCFYILAKSRTPFVSS